MTADPTAVSLEAWVEAAYQSWHKANPERHGSRAKYDEGCRCRKCKEAGLAVQRRWRAKAAAQLAAGRTDLHGLSGYTNLGCRCDTCKTANRHYMREWRKRQKAST